MFKKIIAIVVLCLSFASCERSNPDFDVNADLVFKYNTDDVVHVPIPWVLKNETVHTYVSSGDNALANETKINDYSDAGVYFKPFLFYPDGDKLHYKDYNGVTEDTEWEAIKNNEIVIYSDEIAPEPFEEIVYKITKLNDTQLEMVSRVETYDGNIKTTLRTVLYFERDYYVTYQP